MQVADVIGRTLAGMGVDRVFGVAGSGNFTVVNGLVAAGVPFHAARHEGGAICMADGYARVTGRVGACAVHQGPGFTNALTGLTEAAKSRTPLVLVAADTPASALWSNFKIDQAAMATAAGAIVERIREPATAAADAARAVRRARVERRPVALMVPIDLPGQDVPAGAEEAPPLPPEPGAHAPGPEAVSALADLLEGAQRPVLLAGRGAVEAGAGPALRALAEAAGALLCTSAVAHGLFADDAFSLGIAGGFSSPLATELLGQADVVLAFGASLNRWTTRHGTLLPVGARIGQVDREPEALGLLHRVDVAATGDARLAALAILGELTRRGIARGGDRAADLAASIAAERWRDQPFDDAGTDAFVDPRALTIALDDLLPAERTIVSDSGHFLGWPAMYLSVPDAAGFVFPEAFQSVGLGLGEAIGAAVGRPDRLTIAALGDGGAFMALGELETAVRLGLGMLVLVYDDAAYGAEVHHFGPDGHPVDIARFPDADLAAIARGAGAEGIVVRSVADLEPVRDWLTRRDRPLVVDAKVHPEVRAEWLADAFKAH